MKIPSSIRHIYDEQKELYEKLKEFVDKKISSIKEPGWHYESRVKQINSFCLKLESGRFQDIRNLEDFFACTIVVTNATAIKKTRGLIEKEFEVKSTRPEKSNFTHKHPNSFPFDDLRLYASIRNDLTCPSTGLEDVLFEIQIKTFFQHAWTIATHDLVYKTDEVNWSKQRIAYQIKAMLEHAELSIYEAEKLSESEVFSKTDKQTESIKEIISTFKSHWNQSDLPPDLRKLSENTFVLLNGLQIEPEELKDILNKFKEYKHGSLPLNLSPYGVIIQALFKEKRKIITKYLTNKNIRKKTKILIPQEIELPPDLSQGDCVNAIFVGTAEA